MTVIVPYRDREEHLKEFVPAMAGHDIYVIEQADDKPFNRGKLINVGYLEVKPTSFAANDIDMIPDNYPVFSTNYVIQAATSKIQLSDYLGGCTVYSSFVFKKAEGYHNDFWHRAEDNEMMFNLKRKKIPVINIIRTFHELSHPRTGLEFIPELWEKAKLPRTVNMLETCTYKVIGRDKKEGYTLIKVLL